MEKENNINSNENLTVNQPNFNNKILKIKEKDFVSINENFNFHTFITTNGILGLKKFNIDKTVIPKKKIIKNNENYENIKHNENNESNENIEKIIKNDSKTKNKFIDLEKDGVFLELDNDDILNENRLEERLLKMKQFYFFNEDNKKLIKEENIQENYLHKKLNLYNLENPFFSIIYKDQVLSSRKNLRKNKLYMFEIVLDKIYIDVHPLMTKEELLGIELKNKLKKYKEKYENSKISNLKKTLNSIKEKENNLMYSDQKNSQELKKIRNNFYQIKNEIETIVKSNVKLCNNIYNIWNEIKNHRINTNIINFPYSLIVKEYLNDCDLKEYFFYLKDQEISIKEKIDKVLIESSELKRRQNIRDQFYYIEIYIDNFLISKTDKSNLNWPNYFIEINKKIEILFYTRPDKLKLVLKKKSFFKDEIIAQCITKIPGENNISVTSADNIYINLKFDNFDKKAIKPKKVDKNNNTDKYEKIKKNNEANIIMDEIMDKKFYWDPKNIKNLCKGSINFKFGWNDIGPMMPPTNNEINNIYSNKPNKSYIKNEGNLILNPNDPMHEEEFFKGNILDNIKVIKKLLDDDLQLEYSNIISLRHYLIKLKFFNSSLYNIKIPLTNKEIYKNNNLIQFLKLNEIIVENKNLEKSIEGADDNIYIKKFNKNIQKLDDLTFDDEIIRRIKILRQSIEILKQKIKKGDNTTLSLHSVVEEYIIPKNTNVIIEKIKSFFKAKRNLRPIVKIEKSIFNENKEINLNIQVIKVVNVPIRITPKNLNKKINNNLNELDNLNYLSEAFVNVKIIYNNKEFSYTSKTVQGIDCNWNEIFTHSIKSIKTEGTLNLEEIKNNKNYVIISLFDNLNYEKTNVNNPNEVITILNKRFLASVKIPLYSFLKMSKVNNFLKLDKPIFLFGYITKQNYIMAYENDKINSDQENNPFIPTYISLSLSSEPNIQVPLKSNNNNISNGEETQGFLKTGQDWIKNVILKYKLSESFLKLWGTDINGNSVFIPRYINKLNLPTGIKCEKEAYQKCAHYVSLIPYINENEFLNNLEDLYMTCQQFIDFKYGDFEEHGILLINYFNQIDYELKNENNFKNYLIYGKELIYGETIYLLRKSLNTKHIEIWNPNKAECYVFKKEIVPKNVKKGVYINNETSEIDNLLPLFEVDQLVSENNIYINIGTKKPNEIDWDTNNTKQWLVFLDQKKIKKHFSSDLSKLDKLESSLIYDKNDKEGIDILEENLTDYIARKYFN